MTDLTTHQVRILAKPGTRELLIALRDHPGQCVGAYWSGYGVPLPEGPLRSRLKALRGHGFIEVGRTALTPRGREVLALSLAGGLL